MTKLAMTLALVLLSACGSAESAVTRESGTGADDESTPSGDVADDPNDPRAQTMPTSPVGGASTPRPDAPPSAPTKPQTGPLECTRDGAFPAVFSIAEASGATEVMIGGKPNLLVVADSKNKGAAILIPVPAGAAATSIVLPLDPSASDDIEGLATASGAVYALTSSGAVTRFLPAAGGAGFTRDGAAYRIGADSSLTCSSLTNTNCGKNWEGLCLRRTAPAAGGCAGYAASKAEGALYCVKMTGTTLSIDAAAKPITLDLPKNALSDCSFGENALVVTTNDSNASKSYIVDEKSGKLAPLPVTGLTSNEAVLLGADGTLYQFADSSSPTSASSRFTCKGTGL